MNPTESDPFGGVSGVVEASKLEQSEERLKVAILGKPKSGKSWFAATAPPPVLVYDFDDRKESLAGKPGVHAKTLRDTMRAPTVVKAIEEDLSNFQYRKLKGQAIPKSFVFDTVTNLIPAIKHDYLQYNPKDGRAIRLGGGMSIQIGTSYDLINTTVGFLNYIITEFSALGNVILVFHERDEKDKAESTPKETKYTGLITVDPQYVANILTVFNEVFRITVDFQGRFSVRTKPNQDVIASTTLLVDADEPPNLLDMIAKHRQRKLEQASKN